MKKTQLLLAAVSCVALLAGCAGNGNKSEAKDKDDELSIWANNVYPSSSVSSWRESPFHENLEKQSGIHVEWEFPVDASEAAKSFNLLLSEDKYPDMLMYNFVGHDPESYLEDGVLRDLTDLLPKKAPHYWKFLQDHPDFNKSVKTDDGRYYGFGFFREDPSQSTYMGPMIRKDWLDEQKLPIPETIADWEKTIEVFNDKYDAKFAFTPDGRMSPGLAGAFGAYGTFDSNSGFYVDEQGKIQLAQAQPSWQQYMAWLNKLYKKGLIDPDVITMQVADLQTKVANDQVGITCTSSGVLTTYINDAKTNGSKANWVAIPYPKQENGEPAVSIYSEGGMTTSTAIGITTSCKGKNLDKALKWLDWAFTDEGHSYWNYGTEGESWEMKDGKPTFTDKVTKNDLGLAEAVKLYTGNYQGGVGVQDKNLDIQTKSPEAAKAADIWLDKNEDAAKNKIPLGVSLTAAESKESANILDSLNTYVLENSLKFLTGERSLNEYDKFVSEINDMGLKRVLEIKQDAYDRYLKR